MSKVIFYFFLATFVVTILSTACNPSNKENDAVIKREKTVLEVDLEELENYNSYNCSDFLTGTCQDSFTCSITCKCNKIVKLKVDTNDTDLNVIYQNTCIATAKNINNPYADGNSRSQLMVNFIATTKDKIFNAVKTALYFNDEIKQTFENFMSKMNTTKTNTLNRYPIVHPFKGGRNPLGIPRFGPNPRSIRGPNPRRFRGKNPRRFRGKSRHPRFRKLKKKTK